MDDIFPSDVDLAELLDEPISLDPQDLADWTRRSLLIYGAIGIALYLWIK